MWTYIFRRLALLPVVLVGVSVLIFLIMRLLPGDPAAAQIGDDQGKRVYEELRARFGLDRPIYEQYFVWAGHIIQLDLGSSYRTRRPVMDEIQQRLPISLQLGGMAIALGFLVALPLGILSAVRRGSRWDLAARVIAISGISIPLFWTGTLLLLFTSLWFHWIPPSTFRGFFNDPLANLQQIGIAAAVLAFRLVGTNARMIRSSLLEILSQDFIRTAWGKGLAERQVVLGHALKNAMIPVVTILGGEVSFLVGGTVVTETIFSIPGMGRLLIEALENRDYGVVQGVVLFVAFGVILVNLLVDVSYAWFDPRIRYANH